jgi:hypothetical protein
MSDQGFEAKVQRKALTMPNEIGFVDKDTGEPLDEYGVVEMTDDLKYMLAWCCVKWKQSPETAFIRLLMSGARSIIQRDLTSNE